MFGFLSPAWLAALPVLAIPLALHLWSRRPRHLIRVGSLRHLEGSPGPRAWGRKLEDLPLLLLRLALLTAVVLGLAGPWWRSRYRGPAEGATMVLADPSLVADSLAFFSDPLVDSLRRTQSPIRLLARGFPLLGATGPGPVDNLDSPWSLLRSLDDSLAPGGQVLVIAPARAGRLGAARPRLRATVRWHVPTGSSRAPAIAAAWPAGGDSLGFLSEEPEGWLVRRSVARGDRSDIAVRFGAEIGTQRTAGKGRLNGWSVTWQRVQVVVDKQDDKSGPVLSAAFGAAIYTALGSAPTTSIISTGEATTSVDSTSVIIWLSSQSVSEAVIGAVRSGATLVEFPSLNSGAEVATTARPTGAGTSLEDLAQPVVQRMSGPIPGAPLWVTDTGAPFLTVEPLGAGRHFRLATRMEPDWSDLALGTVMPELAWQILTLGSHPAEAAAVAASQAVPGLAAPSPTTPEPRRTQRSAMLVFAALLLMVERTVVHRRRGMAG